MTRAELMWIEFAEILHEPAVKAQFETLGVQASAIAIPTTAAFIESERARWGKIIKSVQITIE